LAIDYGAKRTGLAICDATETIASPLKTIHGQKNLLKQIVKVVETQDVGAVVIGLPLNMDGSESDQTRLVRRFSRQLEGVLHVPVLLQDERLSSFSAEERLAPANLTKDKMRQRVDAVAAAEILESFLDRKTSGKSDQDRST